MTDSTSRQEIQDILDLATRLAREAGDLTLRYFGGVVDHDAKGDGTPVTIADREAEALIRGEVERLHPEHSILGEEYGESNEGARVRWILDPIDATRSFMRGVPLYGVLIGIEIEGEVAVGVAHYPPLKETLAAGRGLGCTWNGEPCRVSPVEELSNAVVCTTDVERILSRPEGDGWRRLQQRCAFSRTWGDCYGHALVATGRVEVQVDPVMAPWDAGPFLTIVTEAGGRFTTLDREATVHGGSGVSSNGLLHEEVLLELNSWRGIPKERFTREQMEPFDVDGLRQVYDTTTFMGKPLTDEQIREKYEEDYYSHPYSRSLRQYADHLREIDVYEDS